MWKLLQLKMKKDKWLYILAALLSFLSVSLIFSCGIWFDESYTLALIKHDYSDIIAILKDDMHPPLYFLGLKVFCGVFGYSLAATKAFSAIGFLLTLVLGCTIIKSDFGGKTALAYELFLPVYLWCIILARSSAVTHGVFFGLRCASCWVTD